MPRRNTVRAPKLPALPKFPVFPGRIAGMQKPEPINEVPPKPADFLGPDDEWRVYWWLTKHNVAFEYQASVMGGRKQLGGLVPDFLITDRMPPLAINVQGQYWHFGNSGLAAANLMTKIQLLNRGYDVVYVREEDIYARLDYTMQQALKGIQLYQD